MRAGALLSVYRVLALTTGVLLLSLCLALVAKYGYDRPRPTAVIGFVHGQVYLLYVVATLVLAYKRRWSFAKTILVALAGTVPFMSFVAERRVVRDESAARVRPGSV